MFIALHSFSSPVITTFERQAPISPKFPLWENFSELCWINQQVVLRFQMSLNFVSVIKSRKETTDLHTQSHSRKTENKPSNRNSASKNNRTSVISGLVALRESQFNEVIICSCVKTIWFSKGEQILARIQNVNQRLRSWELWWFTTWVH